MPMARANTGTHSAQQIRRSEQSETLWPGMPVENACLSFRGWSSMCCLFPLPAGGDHLRGVLQAGVGDGCAGEHSGHFVGAGQVVEQANPGFGAAVGFALVDEEMLVGEGGDLGQVGDAEDLLAAAEGFELLADGLRGASADADVDFVEDQGARVGSSFWA